MLIQQVLIERVRDLCRDDRRIVAGLMYGSFAYGEGDAFSDIEFVLFVDECALVSLDLQEWVGQITPVEMFFRDDFGHYTAIFDNLVRGEFHFHPASAMNIVDAWRGSTFFPSLEVVLLLDRTGELSRRLEPLLVPPGDPGAGGRAASIQMMFANLILFGSNTLARGEIARALDVLNLAHRYLLWMARLAAGKTEHWPSPARAVERDLGPAAAARFALCTARADASALLTAYREAWAWGLEVAGTLAPRYGSAIPGTLAVKIGERLAALSV